MQRVGDKGGRFPNSELRLAGFDMFRAGGFLQVACAGGTADLTQAERLAEFAVKASYEDLSEEARRQIKLLVLDSIGCALGSLGAEPIRFVREQVDEFGGGRHCTLIGGGKTAPDRAAFYNGALVRYLDFNDSYLGAAGTAHPSDNLAPVLAAAEYAGGSGRDFMAALALAYQVQCRLCDVAEVCSGADATCPVDGFESVATECRGAAGTCDVAETCPGDGAMCPADVLVVVDTEIGGAAGVGRV